MLPKPASRGRKARAPRAPSTRDQEIYAKYNYEGRRQIELAKDYGLSQGRISEIIRRVTAWKITAWKSRARSARQESPADHARLNRQVQEERLNLICREAIRHFYDAQTTVTRKSGTRADKPFEERTERTTSGNLQCLKVALAATRELRQLAASDAPPPRELAPHQRVRIMEEELTSLYEEAIAEGKVDFLDDPADHIDRWLDTLLGESATDHSFPGSSLGTPHPEAPASAAPESTPTTNIPTTPNSPAPPEPEPIKPLTANQQPISSLLIPTTHWPLITDH